MNYSGFWRAVETYIFFFRTVKLLDWRKSVLWEMKMVKEYDPFPIGKGSYKSTNGRFFHCSLVVYPLDTGSKFSIHKSGGRFPAKKRTSKNRGFGDPTQAFIRLDTEIVEISVNFKKNKNQIFWICRILGRATTRMTWSNLKLDDENKFPGIVRIPQSGRSFYLTLFGWREPRSSAGGFLMAFESQVFFFSKMCFRKGWFFWDHSEWPKPGNLDDNQKLDPYIFCIWCYKYQLMVLMFLFDMDPSTSKHKEIEQFRILPFPAVWKIGRP